MKWKSLKRVKITDGDGPYSQSSAQATGGFITLTSFKRAGRNTRGLKPARDWLGDLAPRHESIEEIQIGRMGQAAVIQLPCSSHMTLNYLAFLPAVESWSIQSASSISRTSDR